MRKVSYYFKEAGALFKDSISDWYNRDPFRDSTVISYYAIFSLPGLGIIIINLAGYFWGTEAVTNQISTQIESAIGAESAQAVERIIANASTSGGLTWSSIASIGTLIFGATGVFYQMQRTFNDMWQVKPNPNRMIMKFLRDRLFSFGMILVVGFLLLISLIISSLINSLSSWVSVNFFGVVDTILKLMDITLSLIFITFLFAAIYKMLPDAKIKWRDVWLGALVASLLFVVAKFLLGLYFSISNPGSVYGAAGSIILIMIWTTYSGLILLFGAEFTRVYATRYGKKIEASEYAVSINKKGDETAVSGK